MRKLFGLSTATLALAAALLCTHAGQALALDGSTSTTSTSTPMLMLAAGRYQVAVGESVSLSWVSQNTWGCKASGAWSGAQPPNGTFRTAAIKSRSTYTLTCSTSGGTLQRSVVVDIQSGQTSTSPSLTLTADRLQVKPGETVVLAWSSQAAYPCYASGAWSGQRTQNGVFRTAPLQSRSRFVLTCDSKLGKLERSVLVEVGQTSTTPKLTLTPSATAVKPGGSVTMTWTGQAVSNCQASGSWTGTRPTTGSETRASLTTSQTYSLTCDSASGKIVAMTSVQVWSGGIRVSWAPPRANTDGTQLTDLAGYRIYVGTVSGSYTERFQVTDGAATEKFLGLLPGDYYITMTAVDRDGNESARSNEVLKSVQ